MIAISRSVGVYREKVDHDKIARTLQIAYVAGVFEPFDELALTGAFGGKHDEARGHLSRL